MQPPFLLVTPSSVPADVIGECPPPSKICWKTLCEVARFPQPITSTPRGLPSTPCPLRGRRSIRSKCRLLCWAHYTNCGPIVCRCRVCRVEQNNSCMFGFPTFLPPTNLGLPMHSPSALIPDGTCHTAPEAEVSLILVSNQNLSRG